MFKDRPDEDWASAYDRFILYKNRVPVRGAVLLNDQMDRILLVKGWKKTATWSFPRGKINKDEADIDCAIREAWEETGFDIRAAGLVKDPRKVRHIEKTLRDQSVKLFVFRGVPSDYNFVPQTRKEISKCEWYKISDLPTSAKAKHIPQEGTGQHLVLNANKFYMVAPFVQELKKIIGQLRKNDQRQASKLAAAVISLDPVDVPSADEHGGFLPPEAPLMSPAVPSSLPEVTPDSAQERSLQLKQQLDIPQTAHLEKSNPVMSSALLNLLRSAPAAEMRNDPHTPVEQNVFPIQPRSPDRSTRPANVGVQPPPPAFEMRQGVSSPPNLLAIPQLDPHKRSLLEAFNLPKLQSPALEARQQLPPSKQDLLAAFMSKPRSYADTQSDTVSENNHGKNLLQMLQRNQNVTENAVPTAVTDQVDVPIAGSAEQMALSGNVHQANQPEQNTLFDLLTGTGMAGAPRAEPTIPEPVPAEAPNTQVAGLPKRAEPAELSATPGHEAKTSPASMSIPQKHQRTVEKNRLRKGSTAATLSGPIVQPQFDAIKAPGSEDDLKRPTTSQRKLFDPRNDGFKPAPPKVLSRHDDRNRSQKSPRIAKQQKANHSGRPGTPKESKDVNKPFQPQILRRPQTVEGEASPFSLLANPTVPPNGLAATMTTQSPDTKIGKSTPAKANDPAPEDTYPRSIPPTASAGAAATLTPMPSIPQDPQREALLSLLRSPSQVPAYPQGQKTVSAGGEVDHTPRLTSTKFSVLDRQSGSPAQKTATPPPHPFGPSQVISPVTDIDHLVSRSRVSSLASVRNGLVVGSREGTAGAIRPHIEKRQTAAGDKAFLMNYLKGFASQGQETG